MEDQNKKRSDVWSYFEKVDDGKKAKCSLCSKVLAFCGGTTNLREHLTSKHPFQYEAKRNSKATRPFQAQQGKLDTFVKQRNCSESRATEITERIADMIVLDLKPIASVEGEGFKELMNCVEPGYTCPSRKKIAKILARKHDVGRERLKLKLESATSVSLTSDIWSSSATEGYITVTAHFLTNEWNMYCAR